MCMQITWGDMEVETPSTLQTVRLVSNETLQYLNKYNSK